MQSTAEGGWRLSPQLLLGLFIIGVGIVLTLDNLGILYADEVLRYWPAGLIAIGLLKLSQSRGGRGGGFAGLLFISAGTWLLLETIGIVRVSAREAWPLVLVFIGAAIVWQGLRGGRPRGPRTDGNDTLSAAAVLGGISRGNNSAAFQGGELTAVMGGLEIDLRQAHIDGEAVLNVFAMWGGIDIRVPEDWTVIGRVTPILGGVEDKTRPPQAATSQRLVLQGLVIMGGIDVKN
jgi:predicted membrane protein